MLNTLRTIAGHMLRFVEKYTPLTLPSRTVEDIFNHVKISEKISTSGQPTEPQFHLIKAAGFSTIVNLAPKGIIENSLKTEDAVLKELDLEYIHIPVEFSEPTEEQFEAFTETLQARAQEKVWVHCAVNARVSAFMYRYRCSILNEDETNARRDMEKIWEPFGVWKTFVS